ncbi:phenylalanine--tRNA ligase subunit beta [Patescibacteria group bacterium]|nr:phenylalanine--tRNA ligase subunit beta [Patescibacteria group bacterium]MCL5010372.1 phenylalanine--tRNA ligase subunit beta [Patescibacteria group bacterium]
MNIKILDSWLREYLKTGSTPEEIAKNLSLTSVSVERVERYGRDFVYDIEVTTNRADLMSVVGIAREASAILPRFDIKASFLSPEQKLPEIPAGKFPIDIKIDSSLVNRICALVMEVKVGSSPDYIKERLEGSGIRSLNNLIDITNYVMREIGHPTHVFDYDRLKTKNLVIRLSKKGERIVTLDKKERILGGGDIVADNGKGEIVDLLGVMGTLNSVVTSATKRILFFVDNNQESHIRKTSMGLGLRTEAAIINEKGVDPELAKDALLRGIELFLKNANGRIISPILDIYPSKKKKHKLSIPEKTINKIIGIKIPLKLSHEFLGRLGFNPVIKGPSIEVTVPSFRSNDVENKEDLVEEIARVYGYHLLPSAIPPLTKAKNYSLDRDEFAFEARAKNALKYWGFTEIYTPSMISEDLLDGPLGEAVTIANPLNQDLVYMRKSLIPSLLLATRENKTRESVKIFEIANVYRKNDPKLPKEILMLGALIKETGLSFYKVKGVVEQLFLDLGIKNSRFSERKEAGEGTDIYLNKDFAGAIEVLEDNLIDFELDFSLLLKYASRRKIYKPIPKFPPVIEDVRISTSAPYEQIVSVIKKHGRLVENVSLIDIYKDKKTFRITYRDPKKNLTTQDVSVDREKIYKALENNLHAQIG